jgi:hypothetical protein
MVTRRKSSTRSGIKTTRTQSSKGTTVSKSSNSTKSNKTGSRTTTSINAKTGKISKYVTYKVNGGYKRKKVR